MKKGIIICMITGLCLAGSISSLFAQEQWVGAVPINYIPSFAGSNGQARVSSYTSYFGQTNRLYLFGTTGAQFISYDDFISKIASGIGVRVGYIKHTGDLSEYNSTEHFLAEGIFAPKISIKGKYTISPALAFTYNYINSGYYSQNCGMSQTRMPTLSFKGSLLFNSKKFYFGYSAEAVDPGLHYIGCFYDYHNTIFIHYFQAGYTFQRSEDSKFAFTPQVLYILKPFLSYGIPRRLPVVNLNFRYKNLLAGLGNLQLMLGWKYRNFKLMAIYQYYTYNYSGLESTGNNASVSLKYQFGDKKKK